jgi:hypothetical protein
MTANYIGYQIYLQADVVEEGAHSDFMFATARVQHGGGIRLS